MTAPSNPLWLELGENMRLARTAAGVSLREAEVLFGRSRGLLSQIETGKARPTRELVGWYEDRFGSDGLLLSCQAETRAAQLVVVGKPLRRASSRSGEAITVMSVSPSPGTVVEPDAKVEEKIEVSCTVRAPSLPGTYVAYWGLVDSAMRPVYAEHRPLSVQLVVHP